MNEFVVKKEAEKRELAKKRSPAHDFQRQIKFDPKQHPELRKEEQHPKWKREFSAIADAQGFADVSMAWTTNLTKGVSAADLR